MKTKMKFDNIKGMLRREEMKVVVGGDSYSVVVNSTSAGAVFPSGTTLSGSQNANLGLTIAPSTNYSTSYNYGAGMNGSASTSGSGANTYNNMGSSSGSGYATP